MILVDTREQLPLWKLIPGVIEKHKLDEGDYTTTQLLNVAHIERKSGNDLYGSLIQGHARFRKELLRALDKDLTLAIFVECTKEQFVQKRFKGGFRLKCAAKTLRKIVSTVEHKYLVDFVWCSDRDDLRKRAIGWFGCELRKIQ